MRLTLPTNSTERKEYPVNSGCMRYFPAALAGVARHSKIGNDKHNPGEELHHARGKSMDHADCIERHLMDFADLTTRQVVWTHEQQEAILTELNALAWRALALSQEWHEKFGAPLAPAARLPSLIPESLPSLIPESLQRAVEQMKAAASAPAPQRAGQTAAVPARQYDRVHAPVPDETLDPRQPQPAYPPSHSGCGALIDQQRRERAR